MSAVISDCQRYRYWLERDRGERPLVFVMLNPSTADAEVDDPTIRRCRRFASDNGYTGIIVVNLYAFRSASPAVLFAADEPVGAENDAFLLKASKMGDVCLAWGANAKPSRVVSVMDIIRKSGNAPLCLGKTKNDSPRHPLYVKADQMLVEF